MCTGLQQRSLWPAGILTGLVLLAVLLVAAVIGVNPGIFKRELKSQFLLVCLLYAVSIVHQNRKLCPIGSTVQAHLHYLIWSRHAYLQLNYVQQQSCHFCCTIMPLMARCFLGTQYSDNMRIGKVTQAEMLSLSPPVQVGDWGREGTLNQTAVAALMAHVADSIKPDFILSMGDNFYESGSLLSR